jgi:hypothetical protein
LPCLRLDPFRSLEPLIPAGGPKLWPPLLRLRFCDCRREPTALTLDAVNQENTPRVLQCDEGRPGGSGTVRRAIAKDGQR